MDTGRLLLALRLARPTRRRGFCPACGVGLTGVPPAVRGVELAADGITVTIVLGVAAVAWAVTAWHLLTLSADCRPCPGAQDWRGAERAAGRLPAGEVLVVERA
jgi:hypothetical protein